MSRLVFALLSLLVASHTPAHAQQLLESYIAHISNRDHFNSKGQRLWSAAAIIRQDRANFHRFGLQDPDDQSDIFFQSQDNRAKLERMLERGNAHPRALEAIIHGTPIIRVDISSRGPMRKSSRMAISGTCSPRPIPSVPAIPNESHN